MTVRRTKDGEIVTKKNGKKSAPWANLWMRETTKVLLEEFINAIQFGVKALRDKEQNKTYVPYTPLTLKQVASHLDKHEQTFLHHLVAYPEYKDRYEVAKTIRRDVVKAKAETKIDELFEWSLDVDDKDVARMALDYLKATDKAFNPKIEIEQNVKRLNLDISDDEFKARMQTLMNS
jgi:hypothetical protein